MKPGVRPTICAQWWRLPDQTQVHWGNEGIRAYLRLNSANFGTHSFKFGAVTSATWNSLTPEGPCNRLLETGRMFTLQMVYWGRQRQGDKGCDQAHRWSTQWPLRIKAKRASSQKQKLRILLLDLGPLGEGEIWSLHRPSSLLGTLAPWGGRGQKESKLSWGLEAAEEGVTLSD